MKMITMLQKVVCNQIPLMYSVEYQSRKLRHHLSKVLPLNVSKIKKISKWEGFFVETKN